MQPGAPLPTRELQMISPSSQVDVPPELISGAAPENPSAANVIRVPGDAVISFTVDETGRTRNSCVLETDDSLSASNAIYLIKKWRCQPATKHGRPLACRVRIKFTYGR
jgi:TonB family protein